MGNRIEEAYFDEQNNPILTKEGYHKTSTKFDIYGNEIGTTYYDESENIIAQLTMIPKIDFDAFGLQRVPNNSFILKWCNWSVGESIESLWKEINQNQYKRKEITYISPVGHIGKVVVEKGQLGIQFRIVNIDNEQYLEIKSKFEKWEANNSIKK